MKYRSRIDIISQILDVANGGGATRGRMVYKASLNYNQLKESLTALIENDLLFHDRNTQTFKTTGKGLRFLYVYNEICEMIKEEQQSQQEMWIYRQKITA
jgi:predicted transcriptional regulator